VYNIVRGIWYPDFAVEKIYSLNNNANLNADKICIVVKVALQL
jgi:16S rRNA U1498 N3-methylase RsmE